MAKGTLDDCVRAFPQRGRFPTTEQRVQGPVFLEELLPGINISPSMYYGVLYACTHVKSESMRPSGAGCASSVMHTDASALPGPLARPPDFGARLPSPADAQLRGGVLAEASSTRRACGYANVGAKVVSRMTREEAQRRYQEEVEKPEAFRKRLGDRLKKNPEPKRQGFLCAGQPR